MSSQYRRAGAATESPAARRLQCRPATQSRVTDNGQSSTTSASNNVLTRRISAWEQGTSRFEIRHRFVASAIEVRASVAGAMHAVFSGFTIAPALSMASGVPYTAVLTGNTPNTARISTGVLGGGRLESPAVDPRSSYPADDANLDLRVSRGFRWATARGSRHRRHLQSESIG